MEKTVWLITETIYGADYADGEVIFASLDESKALAEKIRLEKIRLEKHKYEYDYSISSVILTE